MTTWNYRITRETNKHGAYYALREVFYDDAGKVESWTSDPIDFGGDSPIEVREALARAVRDVDRSSVLDIDED